jgi:hypothetical protein
VERLLNDMLKRLDWRKLRTSETACSLAKIWVSGACDEFCYASEPGARCAVRDVRCAMSDER